MGIFTNYWRRIGTRLYMALAVAVILTLVSSAVGVYNFERSGDLNHRVRQESVPVLEAAWTAARDADVLRHIGSDLLTQSLDESGVEESAGEAEDSFDRLSNALARVNGVEALQPYALSVYESANDVADVIAQLSHNGLLTLRANEAATRLQSQLDGLDEPDAASPTAQLISRMMLADDQATLDGLRAEFEATARSGISPDVRAMWEGDGVFTIRAQQMALLAQSEELSVQLEQSSAELDTAMEALLVEARGGSLSTLEASVQSFDDGRVMLAVISAISVLAATLAAWLWVGNGLVRRLSRLSVRMRRMATGDLETPVPEVGQDEIGELADALEVFRQHALEVQRLNLVEQLYGELREAHEELQHMQGRLVAQEKLAALGELVSGVAHEISNPLNFVKNFSEGSQELYDELSEMLQEYRGEMSEEDAALLDDIGEELNDSLNRVQTNGGRALAIVERMRGLGVVGGEPAPTHLNPLVRSAVQVGRDTFRSEWQDFDIDPTFDLDDSIEQVPLVGQDFSEAMINLVSNACYAMRSKREAMNGDYQPELAISSRMVNGVVEVRVHDNGTGIRDDVVGNIFNPFFTTREGALGAGLGLSIAADVARRAGGDLTVDTEYGDYTEFTFSLPTEARAVVPA